MRLFVTGGTGFIGSHFLQLALARGHEVVAQRRTAASRPRIELATEPEWLDRSLEEIGAAELAGVDAVVHLAAVGVSPRLASWDELIRWNVAAPLRLLSLAAELGVKRWVVAGSFAEYGTAGLRYQQVPPTAPLEPTFAYAASKAASCIALCTLAIERQAQLSYLRLFSVYGRGQHEGNLWPLLERAARAGDDVPLTPGEQVRDFVAVEAVAEALLNAAEAANVVAGVPSVRNIGSGRPQTVRAFAEHWWREFGAQGTLQWGALAYRAGEVMRFVPQL